MGRRLARVVGVVRVAVVEGRSMNGCAVQQGISMLRVLLEFSGFITCLARGWQCLGVVAFSCVCGM
jgi:hypothetical protein